MCGSICQSSDNYSSAACVCSTRTKTEYKQESATSSKCDGRCNILSAVKTRTASMSQKGTMLRKTETSCDAKSSWIPIAHLSLYIFNWKFLYIHIQRSHNLYMNIYWLDHSSRNNFEDHSQLSVMTVDNTSLMTSYWSPRLA